LDGPQQDAPRERELKLDLPQTALPAIRQRLSALSGSKPRGVRLRSVYFDTEAMDLRGAGVTLRIRHQNRRRIQTLKQGGGDVGLFDRLEIERPAGGDAPGLTESERDALSAMLDGPCPAEAALLPVFATEVKRSVYLITRGESLVEVAVDDAAAVADEGRRPFCELELELRAGDAAELFRLARELGEVAPLRISVGSKASRGYALLEKDERLSFKAKGSPIRPGMTVAEAFLAVLADCVGQFRRNEDLLLVAPQDKALHQARVALRRLRSAFTLFRDVIADPRTGALAVELKWLANSLGAARDLDVLIERQESGAGADAPGQGAAALTEKLVASRDEAYGSSLEALKSPRALKLMMDLTEWAALGAWRTAPDAAELRDAPVEAFAARTLDKRLKRFEKKAKGLAKLTPEDRHEARIEAKKLRYATDFFGGLYAADGEGGRHAKFLRRLTELQDVLGELNDVATAQRLTFEAVEGESDAAAAFAAGRLAGKAEARIDDLLEQAGESRSKLRKAKPFWR
jgi:inorganic triphosphatase YgiF